MQNLPSVPNRLKSSNKEGACRTSAGFKSSRLMRQPPVTCRLSESSSSLAARILVLPDNNSQILNLYPTPQIVSMYCGFEVLNSIFSLIFLIWTVTVAMSPTLSMFHILAKSSSLLNT